MLNNLRYMLTWNESLKEYNISYFHIYIAIEKYATKNWINICKQK